MSHETPTAATHSGTAIGVLFVLLVGVLVVAALWYMLVVVITPLGGDYTSDYAAAALRVRSQLLYFGFGVISVFGGVGLSIVVRRLSADTHN